MSSSSAHQPRKSAVDQQPTTANVNLETELELALEFSRQTFMEEEAKRAAAEHHSADLIVIEDPALIERNRQVEQIKQLLKNSSVASPNSPPPFTNPFLPLMLANDSRATSVVQQPFSAPASYAAPSASAHHHFCLPSTSSQTSFECSQLNLVTLFPTPETTTAQAFPNRFPKAAPFNNGSTSTIGQQQQPLFIHANLNTLKQDGACLASPLKVPFRQGDLIDLNSPGRNVVRSMELEEFDPLYKKLEIMRSQQEVEEAEKSSKNEAKGEEQNEDGQAPTSSIPSSPPGQPELTKAIPEENPKETRPIPIPRMSRQMTQHRLLTCEDLKANCELVCDFYKEKQLLSECAAQMALPKDRNVFFQSPVLDYFVTTVDTIKLQVHQDDSWARDTPDEPRRLELACDVRSCSEEILVDVLLRLLPQEEIARNQGHIPLADYVLKVFGTDEFLDRNAPIGKHPFVADFLAKGRDVELEVGRYQLPMTPTASRMPKMSATAFPIVNKDLFNTFIQTLTSHVEKCLTSPEDKKLRQPVLQSIKMITTFMNNTQSTDLLAALDLLYSANCTTSLQEAVNFIVASLIRLFRAYCRSSLTDFSVPDPLEPSPAPMPETRDSALCNEKLLLSVESAHNLPGLYAAKYKAFFLEAHLMYGPKSFGMCVSPARPLTTKYNTLHFVPVQLWVDFDVHISSLPRETQVCFILRGVPIVAEPESTGAGEPQPPTCDSAASSGYASVRNSANSENGIFAHQLASASLPLYNVDDFLLQGPLLLPLRQMEDDVVQPWGPRPLVRQPDDIILVVKALEFEYRIQFPSQIAPSGMLWREFDTLPAGDRESLQTMIDGAVSHQLADDDREFLWSNRHYLHRFPRALPLVLSSSFSWGTYSLGNIYALIEHWAPLPPDVALELLLPYFQDKKVRKKALESLAEACSDFLFNLITQFVEALRYECLENSALALFLLEQSTKDRRFAFELFWQLQHRILETKSPSYAARCQLLRQMLLELNTPGFENEVVFQQIFLDRLDRISTAVKGSAEANMTKTLHKQLFQLSDELDMENVRIPVAPSFRCKSIAVAECSIFNSLSKPMKIMVKGKRSSFGIIYKVGDDLRQDAVVIQLVRAMNNIWLAEQLDLRMILFRCLPTGSRKGLIELVPNCSTLREIQIQMGSGVAGVYRDDVLANWLARQNPSEFQYKAALENFRRSCAGWCVATYVLGIGDRHNDNILVTKNGHVFHIDFGKYMGDWQMAAGFKRDRVPFVFTPEMAFLINGGQSSTEHFQRFVDECCQGLNLLRKNCSMVLNIMRFLSCSEIPGMSMESVNFVENNLMLDLNDVQATVLFTRMIEESLQSRFPRLNFFAHTLAQFKGNPLQISGVTKTEDMNRLSFISEIYTEQAEGRIESVLVNSYEKWQENGRKIYMYKLLVKRRNENVNSQIYRSFQEFQELHWKLCYRFSSRAIPSLSHTVNVGRTNIRAVAVRRQVELQYFLQRLFALADEVSHSELVYTFLHPLYRDTEPETRKLNGMPDIWADADSQCQLLLRISLDEPNAELRIFVGHAKNLPLVGRVQAPDSYAKIYLRWKVSQQEKQWKRKTQVVRNAQNPTYNTEICYSLADNQRHHLASASRLSQLTSLDISIWHSGNAVLKDNFPLCETRIHLNQLEECRPNRKGVKELESWFNLETSYG